MNIQLKRRYLGEGYTIGSLSIDGQYFCDTLEDAVRQVKVYGKTAIPYGRYNIILNVSPRFGRILPRLLDVPQFEGVLIHRGNTAEDTAGCILVGENKVKGKVINSTPYEIGLVKMMQEAIDRGENITIEII
jgi:hypothetical protein